MIQSPPQSPIYEGIKLWEGHPDINHNSTVKLEHVFRLCAQPRASPEEALDSWKAPLCRDKPFKEEIRKNDSLGLDPNPMRLLTL